MDNGLSELAKAKPQQGEIFLVLGAGGAVGDAAVQLVRSGLFRCKVLRGGRGDKYDIDTTKFPDMGALANLTEGKGLVDVVVDSTGEIRLMIAALSSMGLGGRMTGRVNQIYTR